MNRNMPYIRSLLFIGFAFLVLGLISPPFRPMFPMIGGALVLAALFTLTMSKLKS